MKLNPGLHPTFSGKAPELDFFTLGEFGVLGIVCLYIAVDIGRQIHRMRHSSTSAAHD
jgi:hypothetical protein